MPKLTINGQTFDVEAGKRLATAIKECGINIGHRCGGYAGCTTCRVEFEVGEPDTMTQAEYDKLHEVEKFGEVRLSCQITCDQDISVKPIMTLENQAAWKDTGPELEETVTPEAVWYRIESLQSS